MDRQIKLIIYGILLFILWGCRNDLDSLYGGKGRRGTPVSFTAEWPKSEDAITRGGIPDKTEFEDNDVIHVSAVFTLMKGTYNGSNTITQYSTLTWNKEKEEWVNLTTEQDLVMEWPWNSVKGTFTAYYLKNWNGPITVKDAPLDSVVLDRFVYEKTVFNPDPLCAQKEDVAYGNAVNLEFKHLCTRLTIKGVGDEDEYWLRFKNGELDNACTMKRKEDNTLEFDFVAEDSKKIASSVDKAGDGNSVTFHLPPGDYQNFSLTRRNGYPYITISNVKELVKLEAGESYTVSIENLTGNITQDDMDDDWWNDQEDGTVYKGFEIKDFMEAIRACDKDYRCKLDNEHEERTLLRKHEYRKEMVLTANVDFENNYFDSVDLPDGVTFNGGKYFISNVAHPLFGELKGTVKELELKDTQLIHNNNQSTPNPDPDHDIAWGVLARICTGGVIEDVCLTNANINVVLHNEEGEDASYNVGALVGWVKSGKLKNITLAGNIDVTVEAQDKDQKYMACIGGVVGQCNGMLENINSESSDAGEQKMAVSNRCGGHASRYTGGVVGLLAEGSLSGCNVRTTADASRAEGTWNYVGGVVGAIRTTADESGAIGTDKSGITFIHKATVSGKVTGGKATDYQAASSHSSTGGIVGHVRGGSVTQGRTSSVIEIDKNYVEGSNDSPTYYTIGGVIGSVDGAERIEKNIGGYEFNAAAYDQISHYYAGRFAGGAKTGLIGSDNTAAGTGNFVSQKE